MRTDFRKGSGLVNNLNELLIDDEGPGEPLKDYRAASADQKTVVLFRNLEAELVTRIRTADVVVGCVAWLTSAVILQELGKKRGVSIIVQKEDFLRPDLDAGNNWRRKLRKLYDQLPRSLTRYDNAFRETVLHMMSFAGDPSISPVRCLGNLNSQKLAAFPRAHHKFVVFCRQPPASAAQTDESLEDSTPSFEPYEVWTGSFNFTKNASFSFENAIISKDRSLVTAFFREYAQLAALSEDLDWETEWSAPQWRIGS
jgi:hypothetical protein